MVDDVVTTPEQKDADERVVQEALEAAGVLYDRYLELSQLTVISTRVPTLQPSAYAPLGLVIRPSF